MEEIWKDIEGYEGRYQVSNLGNVKSFKFNPPKNIYQDTTKAGYKQVKLYKNRKSKNIGVHILVAKAFVDGYKDGLEVNHKDLDKTNNVYTNLEWVTRSENQQHQYKLRNKNKKQNFCPICGKPINKNALACVAHRGYQKWPDIEQLKEDLKTMSFLAIGKKYNYSDNGIRKICKMLGLPSNLSELKEYRKCL